MVKIHIDKKIVDEHLLSGQTIQVQYYTAFNNKHINKTFPNDFSPEEQLLFKQIYEKVVYESEVGSNVYKCSNSGTAITISGFTRTGPSDTDREYFSIMDGLILKFTRYGIDNKTVELSINFEEPFNSGHLSDLAEIGIVVEGTGNSFQITSFQSDISVEVIKTNVDSFIDLGEFKNGKIIFKK